jgi:hypothetical protein
MKYKITKMTGDLGDDTAVGKVHLMGAIDSFACGLAIEEYDYEPSKNPITCITCQTFHEWAKKAAKIKS